MSCEKAAKGMKKGTREILDNYDPNNYNPYANTQKDETMRCVYCGSVASIDNKFYTVDCCVRCHKKGLDR